MMDPLSMIAAELRTSAFGRLGLAPAAEAAPTKAFAMVFSPWNR
jgi:hypothetical protein